MTKVDIFSGFLGAGKTTLIKKLIAEAYAGEQLVLIENEFGEIGIDGGFMAEAGIQVNELNSGCICCSLVGDFAKALQKVVEEYHPDRILIEPSGVGKLSDIIRAVADVEGMDVNSATAVADAGKVKMYMKNFGEFYDDQIRNAGAIVLSRTQKVSEEKLAAALELLRTVNPEAVIITTPWDELAGDQIREAIERTDTLAKALAELAEHAHEDDDDECDDPDCECHHHHHDDDDDGEHEHEHHHHHHHHDDDDECDDPDCECHHHHDDDDDDEHEHEEGHHHHHHHHHHEGEGEVEEYGIGTYVYFNRRPFDINKFDSFVARHWPLGIIRAKGICYFSEDTDLCYLFEQAGKQVSMKNIGQWYATMPKDELEEQLLVDAQLRRDWDPEYGDRMQKLVFIGQDLDKKAIKAALDFCLD